MISRVAHGPLRHMLATSAGITLLKELGAARAEAQTTFQQTSVAVAAAGLTAQTLSVSYGRMSVLDELVTSLEEIRDEKQS